MGLRKSILVLNLFWCAAVGAQDVIVTRHFSGHWDQPEQESQGIILQVLNQAGGLKNAAAYLADGITSSFHYAPITMFLADLETFFGAQKHA